MNFCRLSFARILAGTMTVAGFVAVQGQQTLPSGGLSYEYIARVLPGIDKRAAGRLSFRTLREEWLRRI